MATSARAKMADCDSQTEIVLYPSHTQFDDRYSHIHAESYKMLGQLRLAVGNGMTALGGTVYDLMAFKDVMLQLEDRLPGAPLTDLLLLTSKLYRESGDLSRLLQVFFQNVFSDGYTDETFHFTDVRLMKMELASSRAAQAKLQAERDEAVRKYTELSRGLHEHAIVVKSLEDRNDTLELRSSALEDQMALLFSQLADDFVFYNEDLLEKTTDKMSKHDTLAPARSAFSQSVEGVNKRLVYFQNVLNDIYNDAKVNAISEGNSSSSVKSKLKQLDQNAQHMIQRFTAVKDGLMTTSEELVAALKDKKRIINFSLQHIKLFDVQSTKLRAGRALMHEIRQRLTTLEREMTKHLLTGAKLMIAKDGEILPYSSPLAGSSVAQGQHLAIQQPQLKHTLADDGSKNVRAFQTQLLELQDAVQKVSAALDTTAEQKVMLKTISLSTPSTGRAYGQDNTMQAQLRGDKKPKRSSTTADASNLLTSLQDQYANIASTTTGSAGAVEVFSPSNNNNAVNSSRTQHTDPSMSVGATTVMLRQLKNDYITKLNFLTSVYEGQLGEYEEKIEVMNATIKKLQSQLKSGQPLTQGSRSANTVLQIEPSSSKQHHDVSTTAINKALALQPVLEGGSSSEPKLIGDPTTSATITSSYRLLKESEVCNWHKTAGHQIWSWHFGAPLELFVSELPNGPAVKHIVGDDIMKGQVPQVCVPPSVWQLARSVGKYTVTSCINFPQSGADSIVVSGRNGEEFVSIQLPPVGAVDLAGAPRGRSAAQPTSTFTPIDHDMAFQSRERWASVSKTFKQNNEQPDETINQIAKSKSVAEAQSRIGDLLRFAQHPSSGFVADMTSAYEPLPNEPSWNSSPSSPDDNDSPFLRTRARGATNAPEYAKY